MRNFFFSFLLVLLIGIQPVFAQDLLISRFLSNPKGKDKGNEWIEIKNIGGEVINLSGWKLDNREGSSKPYSISGILKPKELLRVFSRDSHITLRNTGDQIRLFDPSRKLVDELKWEKPLREGQVTLREDLFIASDTVVVTGVIDGDTIEVNLGVRKEKIRLIGVDTPETVHPNKPAEYFGFEASEYTRSQLINKTIRLEYEPLQQKRDEYNRILAYVYLDDRFFNADLIRFGYARAIVRFPFQFVEQFRQLEHQAQQGGVGLWKKEKHAETRGIFFLKTVLEKLNQSPFMDYLFRLLKKGGTE